MLFVESEAMNKKENPKKLWFCKFKLCLETKKQKENALKQRENALIPCKRKRFLKKLKILLIIEGE